MPLLKRTIPSIKDLDTSLAAKIEKTSIVNDLTTGGTQVPLSAEQGKVLKQLTDAKIDTSSIVNDLTTGGAAVPASAETVKSLKTIIDGMANGVEYKGPFDASAGAWPTGSTTGDMYKVSVAGTIDSVELNPNDVIMANNTVSGATTVSDWDIFDNTEAADILRDGDVDTDTGLGGVGASNAKIPSQKAVKDYIDAATGSTGDNVGTMIVEKSLAITNDNFVTAHAIIGGTVSMDIAIVDNGDGSYDEWEGISVANGNTCTLVGAGGAYSGKVCKVTYMWSAAEDTANGI